MNSETVQAVNEAHAKMCDAAIRYVEDTTENTRYELLLAAVAYGRAHLADAGLSVSSPPPATTYTDWNALECVSKPLEIVVQIEASPPATEEGLSLAFDAIRKIATQGKGFRIVMDEAMSSGEWRLEQSPPATSGTAACCKCQKAPCVCEWVGWEDGKRVVTSGTEMPDTAKQVLERIHVDKPDSVHRTATEQAAIWLADRLREVEASLAEVHGWVIKARNERDAARFDLATERAEAERKRQVYIQFEEEIADLAQLICVAAHEPDLDNAKEIIRQWCPSDQVGFPNHIEELTTQLAAEREDRELWRTRALRYENTLIELRDEYMRVADPERATTFEWSLTRIGYALFPKSRSHPTAGEGS